LSGLFDTDPDPAGLTLTDKVYWLCVKLAVTFLGVSMVIVAGFDEPVRSPDQFKKLYPVLGVAVTVTG
jgi:hypothetical protein